MQLTYNDKVPLPGMITVGCLFSCTLFSTPLLNITSEAYSYSSNITL